MLEGRAEDRTGRGAIPALTECWEPALADQAGAVGSSTGSLSSWPTAATMFGHRSRKDPGKPAHKVLLRRGCPSSQHSPGFLLPLCISLPTLLRKGCHSAGREHEAESPGQAQKSPQDRHWKTGLQEGVRGP